MTQFFLVTFAGVFCWLGLSSLLENEGRAAAIALALAALSALVWGLILPWAGPQAEGWAAALTAGFILLSFIPFFPKAPLPRDLSKALPYDERDTMFARNNLAHYPELMETYYQLRPENRAKDRQIHAKPGFGSPAQTYHDPVLAPGYLAAFDYLEKSIPLSDGLPAPQKTDLPSEKIAEALRSLAKFYGGCGIGITPLRPLHFYNHKGRHAKDWGKETDRTYQTAITIVVPMAPAMLKQAPTAAVIQESARAYVEAAKISNILAGYIRSLGYRARAHNDANYETLCVPLAVASGLGELGRMGIFMDRVHGPCVRLATVTTDLLLPPTKPGKPTRMDHFCRICKKCADNCPSGAVSSGPEPFSRGFRHWSIAQEKCFSYWKSIGSDCGLCIAVCPYTKPATLFHRLVRTYISRNMVNQYLALLMDDLFYGRKKTIPKENPKRPIGH